MGSKMMKVKDIRDGRIYAIRMPRTVNRVTGDVEPFTVWCDEFDPEVHEWQADFCRPGQVISRVAGDRTWNVRVDGTERKVYQQQFEGRWDDYIADVDVESARDRMVEIAVEMGWADSHMETSPLFDGPVGYVENGKVHMEFTAEQAHCVADAIRDMQVRNHRREVDV